MHADEKFNTRQDKFEDHVHKNETSDEYEDDQIFIHEWKGWTHHFIKSDIQLCTAIWRKGRVLFTWALFHKVAIGFVFVLINENIITLS